MRPAPTFETVIAELEESFGVKYSTPTEGIPKTRMVGLLFAPKDLKITRDDLIPSYDRFNIRSGKNIDFFWAGYSLGDPESADSKSVEGSEVLWYSDLLFDSFRQEVEVRTSWQYGGGAELLLLNALYVAGPKTPVVLDLGSVVRVNLGKAVGDKVIESVSAFFENVFRYAEKQSGDDPTWGFSHSEGVKAGRTALLDVTLSALPFKVDAVRNLFPFLDSVGPE